MSAGERPGLTATAETITHLVLDKKGYETSSNASSAISSVCHLSPVSTVFRDVGCIRWAFGESEALIYTVKTVKK